MSARKREKSPWVKARQKPGPKKAKNGEISFEEKKKENLAASDKGSCFDQPESMVDDPNDQQPSTSKEVSTSGQKLSGMSSRLSMATAFLDGNLFYLSSLSLALVFRSS